MSPVANSDSRNGNAASPQVLASPVAVGNFPRPPTFATKEEEREYAKFRLAQAFRIFGELLSRAEVASCMLAQRWLTQASSGMTKVSPDISRFG